MGNISLEVMKDFRIDDDAGDQTLSTLLESAKEYLANAGVKESNNYYLYKLAVMVWVSIYYEMDDRTLDKLKQSLQTMILQLAGSACNMNPGKLNRRITFQKHGETTNENGFKTDGWVDADGLGVHQDAERERIL
ncbi:head-tail connector protein [Paenibacillus larvae]|nr:head-tail connector protein [Paenibacillus larvae]MDT2306592.1 head-tail connector protein [Paenibacillus larvae]